MNIHMPWSVTANCLQPLLVALFWDASSGRGEPPEARKAFALALGKRPHSPFIKALVEK